MERRIYTPDHEAYRRTVRAFVQKEVVPNRERWEGQHHVDRDLFLRAGELGVFGFGVAAEHGGSGIDDFRYNAILSECLAEADVLSAGLGLSLQADIAMPYIAKSADDEQQKHWLPGIVTGRTILAVAMTEPGAGSDLANIATTAVLDGDEWVINGAKTFITNGTIFDMVITAVKTDEDAISLLVIEADRVGVAKGVALAKQGQHAADTAEIFFQDVRVPAANLIGAEGSGLDAIKAHLTQERLAVAVQATAQARRGYQLSLDYALNRRAYGGPIGALQHNRFVIAEMKTEVEIAQIYLDEVLLRYCEQGIDHVEAAQAKWWTSELCQRVLDRGVQLHGGYGYMNEYPIARAWADSRIQTIYAGSTELLKDTIGKSLGLRAPKGTVR